MLLDEFGETLIQRERLNLQDRRCVEPNLPLERTAASISRRRFLDSTNSSSPPPLLAVSPSIQANTSF